MKIINKNKLSETFKNNINNMHSVAVEYFKGEELPLDKGGSKKITLEEMIEQDLIISLNNDNENKCDTKNSYSKITREKNKYKLETTLKCGKEKDTITKDFSLKDCKNCNNKEEANNKTEEIKDKEVSETTSNDSSTEKTDTKTTYYEYVKETTTYSKWLRGDLTGDNIENKYEYYAIAKDTYYTLGYIKENQIGKTINYTVKLDKVPNDSYYFTTIETSNYYTPEEETKYINEKKVSLVKRNNENNDDLTKYSLGESNFTYKLKPYYRKGSFYIDIIIEVNNTNGVSTYKDTILKTNIYYVPLKIEVKFASSEINTAKPNTDYETISYYRYVEKNREVKWSAENSLEGFTKTDKVKYE